MSGQSPGIHTSQTAGTSLKDGIAIHTGMEVDDLGSSGPAHSLKRGSSEMQIPGGNVSDETAPTSPSGESEQKKSKPSSEKGVLDKDVILDDTSVMHVTIQSTDSERPLAMAKLSPFKTIELLQELIGEYPYSKLLNSGALLVQCAHKLYKLCWDLSSISLTRKNIQI